MGVYEQKIIKEHTMKKRRKKNSKRLRKLIRILPICLVAIIAAVLLILALQVPKVTFADSLRFPVDTELSLSDVVKDVQGGRLSEPEKPLDSSKKGLIQFTFTVENLFKIQSEKEIMVEFYSSDTPKKEEPGETEKPNTSEKPSTTTTAPSSTTTTKPTTTTKKPTTTTKPQNNGENPGESGSLNPPFGSKGSLIDGVYTTSNGKTLEVKNGIAYVDGILIANKSYSLPKTYTSPYLQTETEQAYYQLQTAAVNAGILSEFKNKLVIKSAYRSWNDQNYIFNNYVKRDGLDQAMTYSARPGHSEHQTGMAMDLLTSSTAESKTEKFKPALDWLSDNAYKYGFILRYPEGKTHLTGYIFEPWHYRYVGTELAEILYNGGDWITLEEYFGIDSAYRGY